MPLMKRHFFIIQKHFPHQYQHISTTATRHKQVFIFKGGQPIKSEEGATQGDPTTMAIYALGITALLAWLNKKSNEGNSASFLQTSRIR